MNDELAVRIFDELYDEDDLNELHRKKVIAQPLGFKLSTIAVIECELNAYHGRLAEENAKLREMLKMCADKLDKEVGFTGVANSAHFLLDELKD